MVLERCTNAVASPFGVTGALRMILKQSLKWQTRLYTVFVDFQKAFDSVDREVIWKLMRHYGFPAKIVNISSSIKMPPAK